MNRLTRDTLITRALDMVDNPQIDKLDRPGGVIDPNAKSLGWLQDGLDLFHNVYPWAGLVTSTSVTLGTTGTLTVPTDFVLDMRDGIILTTNRARMIRQGAQEFLTFHYTGTTIGTTPSIYATFGRTIHFAPIPSADVAATLWYYSVPNVLVANVVPNFPSDWVLVEWIRYRCLEHLGRLPPGTSAAFAEKAIGLLQASGLANEPEGDMLALDRRQFLPTGVAPWDWMGSTTIGP